MFMWKVIPVRELSRVPKWNGLHRVLFQAREPGVFRYPRRKNELARGKHLIEVAVCQWPRPIGKKTVFIRNLRQSRHVTSKNQVLEKVSSTTD
jgi:hypothetical protein